MSAPRRLAVVALAATLGLTACGGDTAPEPDPEIARLNRLADPRRLDETSPDTFRVRFETTTGAFLVEVRREWAPLGADRFYNLVRAGYYDDVYVHRVLPERLAQFGIHGDARVNYVWGRSVIADDPVVASNTRGRLTFANSGPNSRSTEVFISLTDNSGFDARGFAPVGEVVEGMEVVDAFYGGYGDGPPRGEGPYPAQAEATGNAYFEARFPELTRIVAASVEGEGGSPTR